MDVVVVLHKPPKIFYRNFFGGFENTLRIHITTRNLRHSTKKFPVERFLASAGNRNMPEICDFPSEFFFLSDLKIFWDIIETCGVLCVVLYVFLVIYFSCVLCAL
jgi:hypothetical protein